MSTNLYRHFKKNPSLREFIDNGIEFSNFFVDGLIGTSEGSSSALEVEINKTDGSEEFYIRRCSIDENGKNIRFRVRDLFKFVLHIELNNKSI